MQPQVQYIEVAATDDGMRLDNFLRRQLKDVPKSRVYRLVRSGEVRVNRGRRRPSTRLVTGDQVRLPPLRRQNTGAGNQDRRPPDAMIERATSAIVRETPDYLLVSKPADMAVHAGTGVDFGLIECMRAARPDEYLDLVHRLDRGTSGTLLVARSRPARRELAEALAASTAQKTYLALVDGQWPEAVTRVDAPLDRNAQAGGQARVCVDLDNGKSAESVFRVVDRSDSATLVEVLLVTGRKHQIRAHAAHIGHPIAGDARYEDSAAIADWRRTGLKRPFLHAHKLEVPRSDGWLTAESALPADLSALLQKQGLDRQ